MKIAVFINSKGSSNWGTQATVDGVVKQLEQAYPNASIEFPTIPGLPSGIGRLLKSLNERGLGQSVIQNDLAGIVLYLNRLGVDPGFLDPFDMICFNGEGAIHRASSHVIRYMGLLSYAQSKGKRVVAVNQTIDLSTKSIKAKVLASVYSQLEFVSVREPLSLDRAQSLGLTKVNLVPDAVYCLKELQTLTKPGTRSCSPRQISVTGSSYLKKDQKSVNFQRKILEVLTRKYPDHRIIYLVNAKTDRYLANKLKEYFEIEIIDSNNTTYMEAARVIRDSDFIVGGRQHPNIFSFIIGTPYLPIEGNSHKNRGVSLLQEYYPPFLDIRSSLSDIESGVDWVASALLKRPDQLLNKPLYSNYAIQSDD
ncbi:polysaccharide pyruvyl transferase family protein [Marinobacterium sp. xm-a-152]|uniref:polysaccharide pyruvyl transferase family protein n=1 Tax=Marinobacterium sp. xm-a-152 TaxID=2497733 RepID=UPI001569B206|nr:polysaccharide pyruvyl transferase family protein [Marinobacterium sp. xm-a-152]NRP15193.1 Polysaccharide pyruvyl transferase [Marinobacterium sp. xm-a-152]